MILPIFKNAEVHEKTWGKELWIHNSEKYCGKILEPGVIHKLRSLCPSKILEVSTQHFENDNYRIEKSINK